MSLRRGKEVQALPRAAGLDFPFNGMQSGFSSQPAWRSKPAVPAWDRSDRVNQHAYPLLAHLCEGANKSWRDQSVKVRGAASKAADLGGGRPLPSIAHSDG
jgi:hypothetical protein